MVRHIVSWNFKPELTEEQRQAVREEIVPRINALKDLVPCALEVKASCPPLSSSNCDLVLYSEVAQADDLPLYQNHPEHQAVLPLIREYFCDRRCCDIQDCSGALFPFRSRRAAFSEVRSCFFPKLWYDKAYRIRSASAGQQRT